jgi:glycosyltransferase involved in cell wall biosynthesis
MLPDYFVGTVLSRDPLVIYTGGTSQVTWPDYEPHPVLLAVADRPVTWLNACWWAFENDYSLNSWVKRVKVVKEVAPTHRMIFVANTYAEYRQFKKHGFEVYIGHHNTFVSTEIFKPITPLADRPYDAVYNATFLPYKRHQFATKVEKLLLIGWNLVFEKEVNTLLPLATIASDKFEPPARVNEFYNQATCGLALSSEEGAMYSAMEYLLAGLPVVTTINIGGRDEYMDGRFCKWVPDKSESVAEAVKVFREQQIPLEFIREETMRKMAFLCDKFIDETSSLLQIDPAIIAESIEKTKKIGLAPRCPNAQFIEQLLRNE